MALETSQGANPNAQEDRFQNLWESGAFNASGQPDPEQGQAAPEPVAPATPEPAAVAQAPEPAPEPEGPEYQSLDEYLTKANLERDSFYELPVTVKVDGKTSQVALKDVLKSYQLEGHVQEKSRALSEQQAAWEAQQAQARQQWEQRLTDAQSLGNLAHQQLLAEFQGVDWNRLRAENPAEWAARNTEFNQRAAAIQQHLASVQAQQEQLKQQQAAAQAAALPKERDKMLEARPDWRDDSKFQAARGEMTSYARKLGFSDAELQGIFDHRYMLILHDAARFAQLQAQAPQVAKRVRAAPPITQPGARMQRDPAEVARTQLRDAFKKNPRNDDIAAKYFGTLA